MAQVITANTQPVLELEKLVEFIDELRRSGYSIGTQQYLAVQELLMVLAAQGRLPAEPAGLKTWLAPILCTSPNEQESFYQEFDDWIKRDKKPKKRSRLFKLPKQIRARKSVLSKLLSKRAILLVAIGLLIAAYIVPPLSRTVAPVQPGIVALPSPAPPVDTDIQQPTPEDVGFVQPENDTFYHRNFGFLRATAVGLPFVLLGIWWLRRTYRRRSQLEKWSTTERPKVDHVSVAGTNAHLYRDSAFRRVAQEMRRHRFSRSHDLDVSPTVSATIRAGGWFTPVYGSRRVSPEYLVLIDRATFRDQQTQLEDTLISRLVEDNVFVDRYYFTGDPRVCRKDDPKAPRLKLRDLAALHPEHYLILFTDGAGLIDPLTGRPQPWLEFFSTWTGRALLTEESLPDWGYREWALSDLGFTVLPASRTGFQLLLEAINLKATHSAIPSDGSRPFPRLVQERPERWLEPSAPDPEIVDELCEELREFLGEEGYCWLGACAIYPVLQWDLTLYFGLRLTGREAFEERLLSIVRLPWFRHGIMPDWLRERFISDLSVERERAVRQVLEELLITSLEPPEKGFTLDVAKHARHDTATGRAGLRFIRRIARTRRLKRLLGAWIESEAEYSPLRDYVFLRFVTRPKSSKLVVLLPAALRRVFLRRSPRLEPALITGVVCAVILSTAAWLAMTITQPNPPRINLVSTNPPEPSPSVTPVALPATMPTATPRASPRTQPLATAVRDSDFEILPSVVTALADGRHRATFNVSFLTSPARQTIVRISTGCPDATILYRGKPIGSAVADFTLGRAEDISGEIAVSSVRPGRCIVMATLRPNGPSSSAVANFTVPRPSQIIFDSEPTTISPSAAEVPITVRLADDGGFPIAPDREIRVELRSASSGELVVFEPSSVVLAPGQNSAQAVVRLRELPFGNELKLLAVSPASGLRAGQKSIAIQSSIAKLMIEGPVTMIRGTTAELTVYLTDESGSELSADWNRVIHLHSTRGNLSSTTIVIPKGGRRTVLRYQSSSTLGKALIQANSPGLETGFLQIKVVVPPYWLALMASLGGLLGSVARPFPISKMRHILPRWDGKQWDLGFVGRILGGTLGGLVLYFTIKSSFLLVPGRLEALLDIDTRLVAFFIGVIGGFASLTVMEGLTAFFMRGASKESTTSEHS